MLPPVLTRIADYVHHYARQTPEREAYVFDKLRVTYAELEQRVEHCAKALLAAGVGRGDRVAVLCTPRPEYYELFLAATGIGAVWMGLNPKYSNDELRHLITDAQPKLLFALVKFEGRDYREDISAFVDEFDFIEHGVEIATAIDDARGYAEFLKLADTISSNAYSEASASVHRLSPALLVYTSGTTGKPKGALLPQYGLCFGATIQNRHFGVVTPSIICNFPINHVSCVADTCCTVLVAGGTLHFQEKFNPERVLQTIESEKISIWGGVPTMFLLQLDHADFEQFDVSSVELILWGGAAMPEEAVRRLQATGARVITAYGMTETSAHTTYTSPDASFEELTHTIGCPDPDMPCRIVSDSGSRCAIGEAGELQFKGDYIMLEYLNLPDATADVFTQDGWFRTGDVGFWRVDGAITLSGRRSEMYKSGGYNVYPREIEQYLETDPKISVAAVVSMPDVLFQEVGVAFMVLTPGVLLSTEEALSHCKLGLANYKVPKNFEILEHMPLLPNGKIDKKTLKKMAKRKHEASK